MKYRYVLSFIAFMLASCSITTPSSPIGTSAPAFTLTDSLAPPLVPIATPAPTFTPTDTSTPAIAPTRIPLAQIDFSSLLIMPGDLPEGYSGGPISHDLPGYIDRENQARCVNQLYQEFIKNNESAGGVTIMVFDSKSKAGQSMFSMGYDIAVWASDASIDWSRPVTLNGRLYAGMDYVFQQCVATVHIRMTIDPDEEAILSYSKKLRERIEPLVCP